MIPDLEDDWTGPHLDPDLTQGLCYGGGTQKQEQGHGV